MLPDQPRLGVLSPSTGGVVNPQIQERAGQTLKTD